MHASHHRKDEFSWKSCPLKRRNWRSPILRLRMSLQPLEAEILVELHQVLNLVTGPDSTFRPELSAATGRPRE